MEPVTGVPPNDAAIHNEARSISCAGCGTGQELDPVAAIPDRPLLVGGGADKHADNAGIGGIHCDASESVTTHDHRTASRASDAAPPTLDEDTMLAVWHCNHTSIMISGIDVNPHPCLPDLQVGRDGADSDSVASVASTDDIRQVDFWCGD